MMFKQPFLLVLLFWESSVNSISNISPISLTACDDGPKDVNFHTKPVGSDLSWTGDFTLPFDIDKTTQFEMEFRWWKNNEWEKNGRILKANACFYIEKFGSHIWKQIKNAAKPPIEGDCSIKAGKYEFNDFVPQFGDTFIPVGGKGRASGKITVAKDGKVFCAILISDMK